MQVTIEYAYGFCEQVEIAEARKKITESAVEDTHDFPLTWEQDEWGEKATQAHPFFTGERRFIGRIYLPAAEEAATK